MILSAKSSLPTPFSLVYLPRLTGVCAIYLYRREVREEEGPAAEDLQDLGQGHEQADGPLRVLRPGRWVTRLSIVERPGYRIPSDVVWFGKER